MTQDRWLVVGASGLVGGALVAALRSRHAPVVGAARTVLGSATEALDLLDRASVEQALTRHNPTVVAVAAAYAHVDGCELDPARSERENVETMRGLFAVLPASAKVVFFSTDHVFDGRRPAYIESDETNPLSVYAQHKLAAERIVLAHPGSLVVRTAWVFGPEQRRKNFVYRVLDAAKTGAPLKLPRDQAGCPTWAPWLAETTIDLMSRGLSGIVHATGPEPLTKVAWARKISDHLGPPRVKTEEVDWALAGQSAPRPRIVVLHSERHDMIQPGLDAILGAHRDLLLHD